MSKKIILNCSPPTEIKMPSPPLSALKSYLVQHGYDVKIIYWNILFYDLQKKFILTSKSLSDNQNALLLFLNYLAIENKDELLYKKMKVILTSISPDYLHKEQAFYDEHMHFYKKETDKIIECVISKFDFSEILYFGFSLKFEQWLFASLLAHKLKAIDKNIPIIVGGISTKESAKSFLKSFDCFDISMWGEGEIHLLKLSQMLEENGLHDFSVVSNVTYRKNDGVIISSKNDKSFVDLSEKELYPDYTEYFEQIATTMPNYYGLRIPIEASRGCHWNKCHFCFLNAGYKYRTKSIKKIKGEILYMMEKHKICQFSFLDNDLVGRNLKDFDLLLDTFIEIRAKEPKFVICVAEIVTANLDRKLIKKMKEAGIYNVQIGYESLSDNLLKKIRKKNTFASNILFIKFAFLFKITIVGLNVILGLIEETEEDMLEAIDNLRFLRFFRTTNCVCHTPVMLGICGASKYAHQGGFYKESLVEATISTTLLKEKVNFKHGWHFFEYHKKGIGSFWPYFNRIDQYYMDTKYSYKVFEEGISILYSEYVNAEQVSSVQIDKLSLDYQILSKTNDKVISIQELSKEINNNIKECYSVEKIKERIEVYYKKGLIYHTKNFEEIISVINIE